MLTVSPRQACDASDLRLAPDAGFRNRRIWSIKSSARMGAPAGRSRPSFPGPRPVESRISHTPLTPKLLVSIAAQRCNLARSLLELRLHGSRTLGNMDRSAPPNNQKSRRASGDGSRMSVGRSLFAATLAGMLALAVSPASSQTLRYANQGDLKSLDPYSLNETFTHGMLGNVYEGLTKRDKDLKIIPASPKAGRRRSRRAGASICARASNSTTARTSPPTTSCSRPTASARRLRRARPAFPADAKVVKVDDYTVDFILTSPNPILHYAVGHLVHHVEEMGGGEQRRRRRSRRPASSRATPRCTPTAPAPSSSPSIRPA